MRLQSWILLPSIWLATTPLPGWATVLAFSGTVSAVPSEADFEDYFGDVTDVFPEMPAIGAEATIEVHFDPALLDEPLETPEGSDKPGISISAHVANYLEAVIPTDSPYPYRNTATEFSWASDGGTVYLGVPPAGWTLPGEGINGVAFFFGTPLGAVPATHRALLSALKSRDLEGAFHADLGSYISPLYFEMRFGPATLAPVPAPAPLAPLIVSLAGLWTVRRLSAHR